jgi:hypothetical protein
MLGGALSDAKATSEMSRIFKIMSGNTLFVNNSANFIIPFPGLISA